MSNTQLDEQCFCLVVPHFNHHQQIQPVIGALANFGLPLIIVDDRSSTESLKVLQQFITNKNWITLKRHDKNQGKGGAVMTGLRTAFDQGYSHAVQVDADGQHTISDLSKLTALSQQQPNALVTGLPQFSGISGLRFCARKITIALVSMQTLGRRIGDPMCGFRVYPLALIIPLLNASPPGSRMDFDIEIMVKADWHNIPIRKLPTRVRYPEGGVSHFHYLRDNLLLARMHTRLLFGMLLRMPGLIKRRFVDT